MELKTHQIYCKQFGGLKERHKHFLPQNKSRCTLKRCVLTWVCSDSTQRTYGVASPAAQTSITLQDKYTELMEEMTKVLQTEQETQN